MGLISTILEFPSKAYGLITFMAEKQSFAKYDKKGKVTQLKDFNNNIEIEYECKINSSINAIIIPHSEKVYMIEKEFLLVPKNQRHFYVVDKYPFTINPHQLLSDDEYKTIKKEMDDNQIKAKIEKMKTSNPWKAVKELEDKLIIDHPANLWNVWKSRTFKNIQEGDLAAKAIYIIIGFLAGALFIALGGGMYAAV